MSHADEGTLHAYLDGEVIGVEREGLEAHLAGCAACRMRLDEARALIERAQGLLGRAAPPVTAAPRPLPRRAGAGPLGRPLPRWVPLAWAATVLIALGGGWVARGGLPQPGARAASDRLERDVVAPPQTPGADAPAAASQPANRAAAAPGEAVIGTGVADDRGAKPEAKTALREERPAAPPATAAQAVALADAAVVPPASALRRPAPDAAAAEPLASGMAANAVGGRGRTIDRDAARAQLGDDAYGIPGAPVVAIRIADDGGIVVEQELASGIIVQLIERRATVDEVGRAAEGLRQDASERLARYVGTLRVEIAGPLSADSLSRLLEHVAPLRP